MLRFYYFHNTRFVLMKLNSAHSLSEISSSKMHDQHCQYCDFQDKPDTLLPITYVFIHQCLEVFDLNNTVLCRECLVHGNPFGGFKVFSCLERRIPR